MITRIKSRRLSQGTFALQITTLTDTFEQLQTLINGLNGGDIGASLHLRIKPDGDIALAVGDQPILWTDEFPTIPVPTVVVSKEF
jgi:hypothetical protein